MSPSDEVRRPSARERADQYYRRQAVSYGLGYGMPNQKPAQTERRMTHDERKVENQLRSIDWSNSTTWTLTDENGQLTVVDIAAMPPELIYLTADWFCTYAVSLYSRWNPEAAHSAPKELVAAAKSWLAKQPAARAIIQSGLRKDIAFSNNVVKFIREVLLLRQEVNSEEPWNDAVKKAEQRDLQQFLFRSVSPEDDDSLIRINKRVRKLL